MFTLLSRLILNHASGDIVRRCEASSSSVLDIPREATVFLLKTPDQECPDSAVKVRDQGFLSYQVGKAFTWDPASGESAFSTW